MEGREEPKEKVGDVAACLSCSGIRQEAGAWQPLDEFLHDRFGVTVQRCLCPECLSRYYPELAKRSDRA